MEQLEFLRRLVWLRACTTRRSWEHQRVYNPRPAPLAAFLNLGRPYPVGGGQDSYGGRPPRLVSGPPPPRLQGQVSRGQCLQTFFTDVLGDGPGVLVGLPASGDA
jgi:hypothetical protein